MKCHGYNITHSNTGACFENALLDAYLQQGDGWYLVGGIDEKLDWLEILQAQHPSTSDLELGAGSTFLAVSSIPSEIELENVATYFVADQNIEKVVVEFLESSSISASDVDVLLTNTGALDQEVVGTFSVELNYQNYCGAYLTNSGFGVELGIQKLRAGMNRVLVLNAIQKNQIGLTLLKHVQ